MQIGRVGDVIHEDFTVTDTAGNRVPGIDSTAFIYNIWDDTGTEVSASVPVTITELGFGSYRSSFTPNATGDWYLIVYHNTYFPWGKADTIQVFTNTFDSIVPILQRILGLVQENFYIDQTTFNEFGCMISGRIRIYNNSTNVGTDFGVRETYCIDATYDDEGRMTSYKVVTCGTPPPTTTTTTTTTTTSTSTITTTSTSPTWRVPVSLLSNVGSIASGALPTIFFEDDNFLVLNEVAASMPGFDYRFDFNDVPTNNFDLCLVGYYSGNVAHNKKIRAWNFNTFVFDDLTANADDLPTAGSKSNYKFTIQNANYVSGVGQVIIQIIHTSTGTAGHHLYIDHLYLCDP
jgi:hypothetical protein